MCHNYHSLSIDAIITTASKNYPITGEHVGIIFVTQQVTIATLWPAKSTLISALSAYISKPHGEIFSYYKRNFDKDKMQLLAKFK